MRRRTARASINSVVGSARECPLALLIVICKAIVEVAALAMFGQLIVGAFNWKRRESNVVYQMLGIISKPVRSLVRLITPKMVLDQHIPAATFSLLFFAWVVLVFQLDSQCQANPAQAGCGKFQEAR
jgi:uncharacterized protein YggT (Ycf19 family)